MSTTSATTGTTTTTTTTVTNNFTNKLELAAISKLKGIKNFVVWRSQVTLSLKAAGLFDLVISPPKTAPTISAAGAQDPTYLANKAVYDKWVTDDLKAQCVISHTIVDDLVSHIARAENASSMWATLESLYADSSAANKALTLGRFFKYEGKGNETAVKIYQDLV